MVKRAVAVSLLNQKLTVRSEAEEPYVQEVAGFVNGKIQELLKQARAASTLTVALLACMNIADELFRYKKNHGFNGSKAAKKVRDLIALVENCAL